MVLEEGFEEIVGAVERAAVGGPMGGEEGLDFGCIGVVFWSSEFGVQRVGR